MNITASEIIQKLKLVCSDIDETNIDEHTSFEKIQMDSMDLMSFMLELEESYKVKIPNADIAKLDSIEQVVKYLSEKQSA